MLRCKRLQLRIHAELCTVLAVLLFLPACSSRQPGDPIEPGFNVYSKQQDIELGKQAAAEIRKQLPIVQNQALQDYIDRLGQKLAAQPAAEDYPYEFTLVNDDSINAFALPGGPIFVNTGLIAKAENEAQVAGVLAHEIAHVALRHGTNQASKASLIQLPAVIAGAAIGQDTVVDQIAQIGLGLGVNSLVMKYSRDAENQADALGTRILADAGYNPIEMANFFEKLEEEGGARPPQFLSSHPNPGNRVSNVQAEIQALPKSETGSFTAGTGNFGRMQQLIAGLPEPPKQQQTMARQQAPTQAPSGGMETFRARELQLAHPASWRVYGGNQSNTVTIAPQNGLVQTQRGSALGYGVVMSYYNPQTARNLSQATTELVRELNSLDPSIQAQGGQRQVQVSGTRGLMTTLRGNSPYGGTERLMLLTVSRPQGVFYMLFVAPDNRFQQLSQPFDQMLNSLQFAS